MTEPKADPIAPLARLVIDRSKWLRGEGSMVSRLLRENDGKMCCLGFYAIERGCEIADIRNAPRPDSFIRIRNRFPEWLVNPANMYATHTCDKLMRANDDPDLDESDREQQIAAAFAEHGVTVEFVGDALKAQKSNP